MTDFAGKSQKPYQKTSSALSETVSASGQMNESTQKALADIGNEMMEFAAVRMQQVLETQRAMLTCTSLHDLQKVQSDFYTQTLEAYRVQASRVMEMMWAARPAGLEALPIMTSRDYDDIPL
ncbi:MAG: hypothetical protein Q4P24_18055 [Rhodobacterales bacterium]|nr:hypothetical protein [Rhodobacterales bacterium]